MIRKTSIETYLKIKEMGLLSEKRQVVYEALYECGPATGMEVLSYMQKKQGFRNVVDSQVRARLNELRERGAVEELGEKICSVSGQTVILWDTTNDLPKDLETKKSKRIWFGLLPKNLEDGGKLFKTREKAFEFKKKMDYSAVVHEFEEI